MKKTAKILLLTISMLLLSSCQSIPFVGSQEDKAFAQEYDWGKLSGRTLVHGLVVHYPKWLAESDKTAVLKVVDSYISALEREYPACKNMPWSSIHIWIHEALDLCVAGYGLRIWCWGWREGRYAVVCWMTNEGPDQKGPKTLKIQDVFGVLPHELFHMIFEWQHGNSDPTHTLYFPGVKDIIASVRKQSTAIALSQTSTNAALAYVYKPWCSPKRLSIAADVAKIVKYCRDAICEEKDVDRCQAR